MIRLESVQGKYLMQSLPPAEWNNNPTEVVWGLKLAEKHSLARLGTVCTKALTFSLRSGHKSIKNQPVSMKDYPEERMSDFNGGCFPDPDE